MINEHNDRIDILKELEGVFDSEIKTLMGVRSSLDDSYAKAVELISNSCGKVVVSGMGKSGTIGQKIVATMVSTGTRAAFLHPGDAIHGDIGLVAKNDVGLLISKSGESEELLNILPYFKELGIKIISITANVKSTLATCSDVVLFTPVEREACPLNLAPTSSSTASLVVGDAIAITLMKIKGFGKLDFARIHPGGHLGRKLHIKVSDVMRSGDNNPVVRVKDDIRQMLLEIARFQSGAVSVVNDSFNLLGLVTDYDIRKLLVQDSDMFALTVGDVMNSDPVFVYADVLATDALDIMEDRDRPFLVLPVLDPGNDKVIGMVHIHDLVAKDL